MKIERISESEIHVTDPQTEGVWRIVASHKLSPYGALIAIEQVIRDENIQPAKGSTLTVNFGIKVQEGDERCHPDFGDILEALEKAKQNLRNEKQDV